MQMLSMLHMQHAPEPELHRRAMCRVPMKKRAAQQKITPDVQTGCICCASGDGKFGGPIWWNTPLGDADDEEAEEHRAVWGTQGAEPAGRKRPAAEAFEEEELDPEVRQRLAALQG